MHAPASPGRVGLVDLFLTITSAVLVATVPGICANVVLVRSQNRSTKSAEHRERVRAATDQAIQDVSELTASVARTTSGQDDGSWPAWRAGEDAIVHRLRITCQDFPAQSTRDRIEMCCDLLSMPHIRPSNEELTRWSEDNEHEPETSRDRAVWSLVQHDVRLAACGELLRCIGALRRGDSCPRPGSGLKNAYYSSHVGLKFSGDPALKLLPDCPQLRPSLAPRTLDRIVRWHHRRRARHRGVPAPTSHLS